MEQRKFGALWIKNNDRGEFMTGEITVNGKIVKIVCFRHTHKVENPKAPDWDILTAKEENRGLTI